MDPRINQLLEESLASERAGDNATALRQGEEALALAQAAADGEALAAALANLAQVHHRLGHYEQCRLLATQALSHAGPTPDRVLALTLVAICSAESSDLGAAEALFQEAADLSRQIGDRLGLARVLHSLAFDIHLPRGQFPLALSAMEEADHLKRELGRPDWGQALLKGCIANMAGDWGQLRLALQEMLPFVQRGSRVEGSYLWLAACLAMEDGDLERAQALLRRARSIAEATGTPEVAIWVRTAWSRWHRLAGDAAGALAWAGDAVAYARRVGYRHFEGQALIERGRAAWEADQWEAAEAAWLAAEAVLCPLGCAYDLAVTALLRTVVCQRQRRSEAEEAWLEAGRRMVQGGYAFLLERERPLAFPMLAEHLRSRRPELRGMAKALLGLLGRVAPPPLRIHCLGRFEVWQGRRRIPDNAWHRRRAGELFRYLLVAPSHTAPRDALLEALWPDHRPASALSLLHQATSRLRRILEPELPGKFPSRYVAVQADWVTILLPPGSTVDYEEFEQGLAQALAKGDAGTLAACLSGYQGQPFPLDCYATWATPHRERLAQRYADGCLALARAHLAAGRPQRVLEWCQRLREQDPWHEEATLLGMQACLALRDRPGALRLFRELERALQQEFGLVPRSDLTALAVSLCSEHQGL